MGIYSILRHPDIHEPFLNVFNRENFIHFEIGDKNVDISEVEVNIGHVETEVIFVFNGFQKVYYAPCNMIFDFSTDYLDTLVSLCDIPEKLNEEKANF